MKGSQILLITLAIVAVYMLVSKKQEQFQQQCMHDWQCCTDGNLACGAKCTNIVTDPASLSYKIGVCSN
jgi:hypothetical protein